MGARLDEHGLTPKKKMFADNYLKCGNLYKSYCDSHVVNEGTKKSTAEKQASRLVREPGIAQYIRNVREQKAKESKVDDQYIEDALLAVIVNNTGKGSAVRAIELLGKIHGKFWEKPAKKLESDVNLDDNTIATKQILSMMNKGLITEESASTWIHTLDQKSKLEERENTNKEILEKLNTINSAMEKRDE